ncbi:MAG: AzlC family ABC transporter permease [Clostridia bacterium]|nr:AzlC family ABC transporter permease [Clostridia bacterium]
MDKRENCQLNFKRGLKDGLPIGLGYLSVSVAFGVQASLLQIPVLLSLMVSMTNLTSAGQLAGLPIIASVGSSGVLLTLILEMIATQLVINARYFLMSINLSQKLDQSFSVGKRFFFSMFITDEIFAVGASHPKINVKYMLGLAVLPYVGWTTGTLLGALASNFLPTIVSDALGIALYAMFIAIIVPPSINTKGVLPTVLIACAISCAFFFIPPLKVVSSGFAIIISAIVAACVSAFFFPIKEDEPCTDR